MDGRTVVVHQAALGDFALIWPLLRALGRQGPVALITDGPRARLAAQWLNNVTAVASEQPEITALYGENGSARLSNAWRQWWRGAGRVVSLVSSGKDPWAANIAAVAPEAQRLFLHTRPPDSWQGHVTLWHQFRLAEQGLALSQIPWPPHRRENGPVLLHPGSGGEAKCWPRDRFERLTRMVRRDGWDVRPVLGEAEVARWPGAEVERWQRAYRAVVCESLDQLAEVLMTGSAFVGNDAGPTHLAAQLGMPTLALFGPTDPQRWRPIGPGVSVLAPAHLSPMTWLTVAQVHGAVTAMLAHR